VLQRLAEADVLLFPSLHDDAPLVIAEARAQGVPVVCLNRGGPRLLAGANGIVVHDAGGAGTIARRLAIAASESLARRRNGDLETNAEGLLLDSRAATLNRLLVEALSR
jgi:glycosyltransferase involved in cell wall biosynthesis